MERFKIDGYWKDNKECFQNYVVVSIDEAEDEDETEVFFFGLDEKEIKKAIQLGEKWEGDFVITNYKIIKD